MQEMQVMQVGSLGQKDPLEEEMATHGIAKSGTRLSIHAQASILSSNSKNNNSFHQNLVMNIK